MSATWYLGKRNLNLDLPKELVFLLMYVLYRDYFGTEVSGFKPGARECLSSLFSCFFFQMPG